MLTDKYLKLASPAAIKVLLLILRNPGEDFTVEELSKRIGYCKADTLDAVEYWASENVLVKNGAAFTSETVESGKPDDSGVNAQTNRSIGLRVLPFPRSGHCPKLKLQSPRSSKFQNVWRKAGTFFVLCPNRRAFSAEQ